MAVLPTQRVDVSQTESGFANLRSEHIGQMMGDLLNRP
jgi:hypothetical protein